MVEQFLIFKYIYFLNIFQIYEIDKHFGVTAKTKDKCSDAQNILKFKIQYFTRMSIL